MEASKTTIINKREELPAPNKIVEVNQKEVVANALPRSKKLTESFLPSIEDIRLKIANQSKENSISKSILENDQKGNKQPYTESDLINSWNDFKESRKKLGNEQEVALLNHTFIHSDNQLTIQIHNPILELTFDKIRIELLSYLRKSLSNDTIKLEIERLENESKKVLYTNKEKFEHLASNYPSVRMLQERLGLDAEY